MRYKLLYAILLLTAMDFPAFPQDIPEYAQGTPLPEALFTPVLPEAFSMSRYGNADVNMYSGSASYGINVYTYADRFFTIPIDLLYRGDGYKPCRSSGTVGTGWTLNVGGVITREIRGLPDESRKREYVNRNEGDGKIDDVYALAGTSGSGHATLKQMLRDYYDRNTVLISGYGGRTEASDLSTVADYAYSGEIGREYVLFNEGKNSSKSEEKFELESDLYHFNFMGYSGSFVLGETEECIVLNSNAPVGEISVKYEYNISNPLLSAFTIRTGDGFTYAFRCMDTCTSSSDWGSSGYTPETETSISCWHLTDIAALNGMTAEFIYSDCNTADSEVVMETKTVCLDDLTLTDSGGHREERWAGSGLYRTGTVRNAIRHSRLTGIKVPGRVDMSFAYDESWQLVSFTAVNSNGKQVRNCSLTYKPFGSQSLLKRILLSGEGEYSMEYYGEEQEPGILPQLPTWQEDWYGYYSSDVQVPEYESGNLKSYSERLLEQRHKHNFEDTRLLMLSRIVYPAGGHSDYEYEQNSYSGKPGRKESTTDTKTGGIRVKSISTYDSDGEIRHSRRFKYETVSGKCSGVLYEEPHIYYKYRLESPTLTIERETVSSMAGLGRTRDCHVGYSRVLEEVSSTATGAPESVIEHVFATETDGAHEEEYHTSSSTIIVKDGWSFVLEDMGSDYPSSIYRNGTLAGGREISRTVYVGSGLDVKLSHEDRHLSYFNSHLKDSVLVSPVVFQGKIFDRTLYCKSPYIKKEIIETYGSGSKSSVTRAIEITGMNDKGRPVCFSETDSRNRMTTVRLSYRQDYPSCLSGKTVSAGGKTIQAETYDYRNFPAVAERKGIRFYPSAINRGLITSDGKVKGYEVLLSVTAYDEYGNPEKVVDVSGNETEYLWGYSGLHLIKKTAHAGNRRLCWFWTWEPLVDITSAVLPDMSETVYGLDEFGRLTSVIESGDVIGKFEYNITRLEE